MNLNDILEFMNKHPKLGYIAFFVFLFLYIFDKIASNFPSYSKLTASILVPLAKKLKFKSLQKAAIKSDIQGKVNTVISAISKEIPQESMKPLEIEWVKNSSVNQLIQDKKILVRIRPIENQEDNLLNVTQPYLESVLIPKSRFLIHESQKKAIVYFTTQEVISDNESLVRRFHDNYYLPDCKKYKSCYYR